MAPRTTSSKAPLRNRFSLVIPLNADSRNSVFQRKASVASMSSDTPSPSSPLKVKATRSPSATTPTRVFPVFGNSWNRNPPHNLNSKALQSTDSVSPDGKGKVGLTGKARRLGKRFGEVLDQLAVRPDENDQEVVCDVPSPSKGPLGLPLSPTQSPPSSCGFSTAFGDGLGMPCLAQSPSTTNPMIPPLSEDEFWEHTSSRSRSLSKSSVKSTAGTDSQSVCSFSPRLDLEYHRKARLEKLNRHLGEEIPPELVLDNIPNSPSVVQDHIATGRPSTAQSQSRPTRRPSTAGRNECPSQAREKGKQRRSLDLSSLTQPLPTPSTRKTAEDEATVIKRNRSLWKIHARQPGNDSNQSSRDVRSPNEQNRVVSRLPEKHISEKQRALNLKRARKMAQMFGSEPPPGLFLFDKEEDDDDDEGSLDLTDVNRQSIATLLALTSVEPPLSFQSRLRVDSTASAASVTPSISMENFEDELTPLPPSPFTTLTRSASLAQPAVAPYSHTSESKSIDKTAIFRERRLRAAKLSRFFGVEYQDISSALVMPETPALLMPPTSSVMDECKMAVDVKVSAPPRFWGLSQGKTKDADVADVIGKLRDLKAG